MTPRWVVLAALALAAGGTLDVIDPRTGERVGTLRESLGGHMDLYDAESRRAGWGRRIADGSIELFALDGSRLGMITRDGRVILFAPPRLQERR